MPVHQFKKKKGPSLINVSGVECASRQASVRVDAVVTAVIYILNIVASVTSTNLFIILSNTRASRAEVLYCMYGLFHLDEDVKVGHDVSSFIVQWLAKTPN